MSTKYSVTGRLFAGSLGAPITNETDTQDYDDKSEALCCCEALAELGYRVWLYERRPSSRMEQPDWFCIGEWRDGKPVE